MIRGIILIAIGVIGVIFTIFFAIKFMKKNNILFRGNYEEIYSVESELVEINKRSNSVKKDKKIINESYGTDSLLSNNDNTELLDEEEYDTDILSDFNDTELLSEEEGYDTELL